MPFPRRPTVAAMAAKLRGRRDRTCRCGLYGMLQYAVGEPGGVRRGNHVGFFLLSVSAFGAAVLAQSVEQRTFNP